MKIVTKEPIIIRRIMELIGEFDDNVTISVGEKLTEIIVVDRSNAAQCEIIIPNIAFNETFEGKVAINPKELSKALRTIKDKDILEITEKENVLHIILKGDRKREYTLPIYSEFKELPPLIKKDLGWKVKIEMEPKVFLEALSDLLPTKPGNIIIETIPTILRMRTTEATGLNGMSIITRGKNLEKVKSKFNSKFIERFVTVTDIATKLEIKLDEELPIVMTYTTPNKFSIKIICAPIMEEETSTGSQAFTSED